MKVCPICGAGAYDAAETCFECLYSFASMSASNCDWGSNVLDSQTVTASTTSPPTGKAEVCGSSLGEDALAVDVYERGRRRQTVKSKRGSIYVGRGEFNDISVGYPSVSRRHLHLYRIGAQLLAEPLDERGETYINGELLTGSRELHESDRLTISDVDLVVSSSHTGSARGREHCPA